MDIFSNDSYPLNNMALDDDEEEEDYMEDECPECEAVFPDMAALIHHCNTAHEFRSDKNNKVPVVDATQKSENTNILINNGGNYLTNPNETSNDLNVIDQGLNNTKNMDDQQDWNEEHTTSDNTSCSKCKISLKDENSLREHVCVIIKPESEQITVTNHIFLENKDSSNNSQIDTNDSDEDFEECPDCDEPFPSIIALNNHYVMVHENEDCVEEDLRNPTTLDKIENCNEFKTEQNCDNLYINMAARMQTAEKIEITTEADINEDLMPNSSDSEKHVNKSLGKVHESLEKIGKIDYNVEAVEESIEYNKEDICIMQVDNEFDCSNSNAFENDADNIKEVNKKCHSKANELKIVIENNRVETTHSEVSPELQRNMSDFTDNFDEDEFEVTFTKSKIIANNTTMKKDHIDKDKDICEMPSKDYNESVPSLEESIHTGGKYMIKSRKGASLNVSSKPGNLDMKSLLMKALLEKTGETEPPEVISIEDSDDDIIIDSPNIFKKHSDHAAIVPEEKIEEKNVRKSNDILNSPPKRRKINRDFENSQKSNNSNGQSCMLCKLNFQNTALYQRHIKSKKHIKIKRASEKISRQSKVEQIEKIEESNPAKQAKPTDDILVTLEEESIPAKHSIQTDDEIGTFEKEAIAAKHSIHTDDKIVSFAEDKHSNQTNDKIIPLARSHSEKLPLRPSKFSWNSPKVFTMEGSMKKMGGMEEVKYCFKKIGNEDEVKYSCPINNCKFITTEAHIQSRRAGLHLTFAHNIQISQIQNILRKFNKL